MSATGRRLALAALGAVLAAAVLGTCWAVRTGPPSPPSPPAPAPAPVSAPAPAPEPPVLRVTAVTGAVDASEPEGGWRPLAPGVSLHADGLIRTGAGASAELAAGATSRITIEERTQLAVRELTAAVHRFRLTRGLVKVDYQHDGDRVVRVEEADGSAVAEARAARFNVAANGLAFAVASQTGTVSLSAAGGTVAVAAGEEALSDAGAAPSAPRRIPTEVLLRVAQASRLADPGRCLDTTGLAGPGALVTVDGEPVPVDAGGAFPVRVARRAGQAAVEVRVLSPDGRVTARTVPCRRAPDADIRDLRVRWKNAP